MNEQGKTEQSEKNRIGGETWSVSEQRPFDRTEIQRAVRVRTKSVKHPSVNIRSIGQLMQVLGANASLLYSFGIHVEVYGYR